MTATLIKTQDAQPAGVYVRTSVDDAKDAADILIIGHAGRDRTIIRTRKVLTSAGIKRVRIADGMAIYSVTEEVLTELRRRFTVVTDF